MYYVGMTRAKERLHIFHHDKKHFHLQGVDAKYSKPSVLLSSTESSPLQILVMGLDDIVLSFVGVQNYKRIDIVAGDTVSIETDRKGKMVIKFFGEVVGWFSKKFQEKVTSFLKRGYRIKQAKVDFVIFWEDKERTRFLKHVLCELELRKRSD